MRNSDRINSLRFIGRSFGFIAAFIAVYLLLLFLLGVLVPSRRNLILHIYDTNKPGGYGHSLKRFEEIKNYSNVDILFCGSSHAYRSFDPRIFRRECLTSYNIGSTSQTPLNTYFLLQRYFEQLEPKLVIMEVYPVVLQSKDGLESCYDLLKNTDSSIEMFGMAIATRNITAINILISLYESRLIFPLTAWEQREQKNQKYIPGGYVESVENGNLTHAGKPKSGEIRLSKRQIGYLEKSIEYIKERKKTIVLVVAPIPKEYIDHYANYWEVSEEMSKFALENGASYIDFNGLMTLDSRTCFMDGSHLSARGVVRFNHRLIKELKKRGLSEVIK